MDSLLKIAKDYATIINSVLLIVLLFKYASDIRKQRLEYKKLECELKALRDRESEATNKILAATGDDLKRFVIDPMVEAIRRREEELQRGHHYLLRELSDTSASMKEMRERSIAGREWSFFMERNIQVIEHLTKYLELIEERSVDKKIAQPVNSAGPKGRAAD